MLRYKLLESYRQTSGWTVTYVRAPSYMTGANRDTSYNGPVTRMAVFYLQELCDPDSFSTGVIMAASDAAAGALMLPAKLPHETCLQLQFRLCLISEGPVPGPYRMQRNAHCLHTSVKRCVVRGLQLSGVQAEVWPGRAGTVRTSRNNSSSKIF
jgi:hypothetical protein